MSFKIVSKTLSADLAASGTTTFNYPASTDEDSFASFGHVAIAIGNVMTSPGDFTLTFGSASVTFTYAASKTTIPAGSEISLQMNLPGEDDGRVAKTAPDSDHVSLMSLVRVDLGSPLVADVNGVAEAQSPTGSGTLTLNGDLVADGTVNFMTGAGAAPFGRAVTCDSGGADTAVLTVTGTDWQGNAMTEALTLNGTTVVAGKKAFGKISSIAHSATISNGAFVGSAVLLGLPFFVEDVDEWVTELEDGVTATAGAWVAGVGTAATATTGDVRGTYSPNSAPDGAKHFVIYMAVSDVNYHGVTQA